MRPRILLDATPLRSQSGLRGIGRFVRDLLHGLAETKAEWQGFVAISALWSLDRSGAWQTSEDLVDAAERAFAARGTQGPDLATARRRFAVRAVRASNADAVHFTEALGLPEHVPVPRIVTCHDLVPLRMPRYYGGSFGRSFLFFRRSQKDYGLADRVIAISEKTRSELEDLLKIDRCRIDVIPHGLGLDFMQAPSANDANLLRGLGVGSRPYVLYVGYSDYRKNVPTMIAALAEARREFDVELVWAGALPPTEQRKVLRLAARVGVKSDVRLLGFVPDACLAALYRRAVAHVFLSRLEGFGFSVAESMATSCPVIVATGSGSDEIAGAAAIRVHPDDRAGAARAIVQLATDEVLRQKLISLGLERSVIFDRKRMAREYVGSYARTLRLTEAPASVESIRAS